MIGGLYKIVRTFPNKEEKDEYRDIHGKEQAEAAIDLVDISFTAQIKAMHQLGKITQEERDKILNRTEFKIVKQ